MRVRNRNGKEEDPRAYLVYLTQNINNPQGKAIKFMRVGLKSHLRTWFPKLGESEADAIIKEFAGNAEAVN